MNFDFDSLLLLFRSALCLSVRYNVFVLLGHSGELVMYGFFVEQYCFRRKEFLRVVQSPHRLNYMAGNSRLSTGSADGDRAIGPRPFIPKTHYYYWERAKGRP